MRRVVVIIGGSSYGECQPTPFAGHIRWLIQDRNYAIYTCDIYSVCEAMLPLEEGDILLLTRTHGWCMERTAGSNRRMTPTIRWYRITLQDGITGYVDLPEAAASWQDAERY